jgi:hypothetical protein
VRGEFKARGRGNFLSNVLETVNGAAWAALAFLLLNLHGARAASPWMLLGAAALCMIALAIPGLGWWCRRRDDARACVTGT